MANTQLAYSLPYKPIRLKQLLIECGIRQRGFAAEALQGSGGESLMNLITNKGYNPPTIPDYKQRIEQAVLARPEAVAWLKEHNLAVKSIWQVWNSGMSAHELRRLKHHKAGQNISHGNKHIKSVKPIMPGDPDNLEFNKEVDMLTEETKRHFKIFRNPFINDIKEAGDVYLSAEHRYIKEVMLDAAKNQGFVAVVGEVGSGKSAIRKFVVDELNRDDGMRIIFPRIVDKTRVTGASLCDAIIMDLSDEQPKGKLEQKSRQVERLLTARLKAGARTVLVIEEAHDLAVRTLKLLKRLYEIEHGYKKALGIILIGQPELGSLFNEGDHYEMREVIRRCQIATIRGLNGSLKDYLNHKFKRAGLDTAKVIEDKAINAISARLSGLDERQRKISNAYPLTVNNLVIRAMNMACDMGFERVTEEVINRL